MMVFDVPTEQNAHRERLRRYLRDKGFGYLQNSVWVTPIRSNRNGTSSAAERSMWNRPSSWRRGRARSPSPIGWERVADGPGEGRSHAEMVTEAWDFERINRGDDRHLKILGERPGGALRSEGAAKALLRWAAAAREAEHAGSQIAKQFVNVYVFRSRTLMPRIIRIRL
jgi:hypothetical protein